MGAHKGWPACRVLYAEQSNVLFSIDSSCISAACTCAQGEGGICISLWFLSEQKYKIVSIHINHTFSDEKSQLLVLTSTCNWKYLLTRIEIECLSQLETQLETDSGAESLVPKSYCMDVSQICTGYYNLRYNPKCRTQKVCILRYILYIQVYICIYTICIGIYILSHTVVSQFFWKVQ